jgi:hypothetical protein
MSIATNTEYSVKQLKSEYKTFKEAKVAFDVKAKSWSALVEKLNAPSYEQLKAKVEKLLQEKKALQTDNEALKQSVSKTKEFDEIGFWLLDNNFDRSRFSDFDIPHEAIKFESAAKAFYKKLAQKYHPDKGGTEMQMSNVGRLYEQMMALVEMNNGIGK